MYSSLITRIRGSMPSNVSLATRASMWPGTLGRRPFSSTLQVYRTALDSHPLLVKSVTASVLSFAADIICQLVVPYIKEKEKGSKAGFSLDLTSIDWTRTAKFSLLGATLNGGLLHYWYTYVDSPLTLFLCFLCA